MASLVQSVLKLATGDPNSRRKFGGDNFSDRLSSVQTFSMLMGFAVITQANQLIGDPIDCWCPAHFTSTQSEYTDSVCWTRNTYFLPYSEEIPEEGDSRQKVGYYQWISLILIAQALMFYLPRVVWRVLSKQSGISISNIVDSALDCQQQDWETKRKSLGYMVEYFGKFLLETSRYKSGLRRCYGHYLGVCYLFVKLLYLANAVGQLFMLNLFLGMEYNMYGIYIIRQMINGEEWRVSDVFPRVTLCDFRIRLLGNIHRYTVQCSLPMNLFNEIIFILIWFWFVIVAMLTTMGTIAWMFQLLHKKNKIDYVASRLVANGKVCFDPPPSPTTTDSQVQSDSAIDCTETSKDTPSASKTPVPIPVLVSKTEIREFIDKYLKSDGWFIIKLVAQNSSNMIAAELLAGLWDHFRANKALFITESNGKSSVKYQFNGSVICDNHKT